MEKMEKNGSLTEDEWTAIIDAINLKAEKIGRPYLVHVKKIIFLHVLSGYQYIIKIFNNIVRRWEVYSVCPFGNIRLSTFKPPRSPFVGAGY